MTAPPSFCPACGSPAAGNYCSGCGACLVARTCAGCRADLSAQARFCHRCGRPAGPLAQGVPAAARSRERERTAWLTAGALCIALLGGIVFKVTRGATAPVAPDMANTGAESARESRGQAPPDISRMSPRERFDRLFNRVMQAAGQGDTGLVVRFTPMALGAYAQLDSADADARYHAAVLRLQVGDAAAALALADTILARSPGHLFGYMVRGTAAEIQRDTAAARRAARDFLSQYDAERGAHRPEYREHQPAVAEFKLQAEKARP